jgi:hypothetical protein
MSGSGTVGALRVPPSVPAETAADDRKRPDTHVSEHASEIGGGMRKVANRIGFRFLFVYLLLYLFPYPYVPSLMPGAWVLRPYVSAKRALVRAAGSYVFHAGATGPISSASSDSTSAYIEIFCWLAIAAAVAIVWTVIDKGRSNDERLARGLRVYVRLCLACSMISYGSLKVIKAQFPDPSLDRLLQPFGDASPMGLLWTFMGASTPYNIFTGAAEVLGGVLLVARRTMLLGALISATVLVNVVMLNFSYDVPVKLTSLHALGLALFLIAPDTKRLANFLVFNRPVESVPVQPPSSRWGTYALVAVRTALVIAFAWLVFGRAYRVWRNDVRVTQQPLYGIWTVEQFEADRATSSPPGINDASWRRVIFDHRFVVQLAGDSFRYYTLRLDPKEHSLLVRKAEVGNPADFDHLSYEKLDDDTLSLEGHLDGQNIRARMRRVDLGTFTLLSRGFHWINESPFDR